MNSNSAIHISKHIVLGSSQFLAIGVLTRAEFALAEWEELNEEALDAALAEVDAAAASEGVVLGDGHAALCCPECADCWEERTPRIR